METTPYIPTEKETELLQKALLVMINQKEILFSEIGTSRMNEDVPESKETAPYKINSIQADLTISLYDIENNIVHDFELSHFKF